jgi:hypothetical protein
MPLHPQGSRGVFGELKGSSTGFGFVHNVKLLIVNLQMYAYVHVDLIDVLSATPPRRAPQDSCAFGCPVTRLVCPCVHPGTHDRSLCFWLSCNTGHMNLCMGDGDL